MLEAKDQGPRTRAQVFFKKKDIQKKIFRRSPVKKVFQTFFQAIYKISTIQENVLSSSREQGNFRGLEASSPRN